MFFFFFFRKKKNNVCFGTNIHIQGLQRTAGLCTQLDAASNGGGSLYAASSTTTNRATSCDTAAVATRQGLILGDRCGLVSGLGNQVCHPVVADSWGHAKSVTFSKIPQDMKQLNKLESFEASFPIVWTCLNTVRELFVLVFPLLPQAPWPLAIGFPGVPKRKGLDIPIREMKAPWLKPIGRTHKVTDLWVIKQEQDPKA